MAVDVQEYLLIRNEQVRDKTGRGWDEWFEALDRCDDEHQSRMNRLLEDYDLSRFWARVVTFRYETERGLRS